MASFWRKKTYFTDLMEKAAPYIRQGLKWTGSLLAAWVLLLVPTWAAQSPGGLERKTYVSCVSEQRQIPNPDCSSTVYHQESIPLVSPRGSFSFLPSHIFLPSLLTAFYRALGIQQPGRLPGSFFCFAFLSPIFEHQITINAP